MNVVNQQRPVDVFRTVPSFALVSTVLNDRAGCIRFFEQMALQNQPPNEIVIVDGGSSDGTWEFLQAAAWQPQPWRLQVRQDRGCNVARGRNLAIEVASHEIIASTDIGCDWEPEWLAELLGPFALHPACQAVMGSWSVREKDLRGTWARVEYAMLHQPQMLATNISDASSRSIAYTRTLWRRLGGYPKDLTLAGDDMVYAILLHRKTSSDLVYAAPVPRCHWERPRSFQAFRKEARRNFRGAGEAGIFLGYGINVGGRMLLEIVFFVGGSTLLAKGAFWAAAIAFLAVLTSVGARACRLRSAVANARQLGVPQPWGRLMVFEYATKLWGVIGFWEGWWSGKEQCRECRRRLREASNQ